MTFMESININLLRKNLLKLETIHSSYNYISITLASSERIKKWSQRQTPKGAFLGEVLSSDTIDYKTGNPVPFGLFCEQIFGPIKNYTCRCGKYSGIFQLKTCENCHVELIDSRVRRYRMGYTDLICPVTHLWYFGERANYIGLLLNNPFEKLISTQTINNLIYYRPLNEKQENELERFLEDEAYKDLITKREELENILENFLQSNDYTQSKKQKKKKIKNISESSIYKLRNNLKEKEFIKTFFKKRSYLPVLSVELENSLTKSWFKQKTGSDFLKSVLENLNLKDEIDSIRKTITFAFSNGVEKNYLLNFDPKLKFFLQKLRLLESFLITKVNPGNIVLTSLPILPPTLRPFFEGENGTLISSDINSSYRLIITQNNNLATQLFGIGFLSFLVTEMKRKLQEVVDNLIEASHNKSLIPGIDDQKPLKGLLEILEGKYGHFRQYLLGKRVDYSARSVIISGPGLRFNQCGLPYDILTKLFQPQILKKLLGLGNFLDLQLSLMAIKLKKPFILSILKSITKSQKVLLNRAPTLHKYGIQSFEIVITLNKAIHLHPLVCSGFNADFDGDQMGIHLPLYEVTQMEINQLMRPSSNFFSLANSESIMKPTQDMVMGCYYLTFQESKQNSNYIKCFSTIDEAILSFYQKKVSLHSPVLVKKKIKNFNFTLENNSLYIVDPLFGNKKRKIEIYKIYKSKIFIKKIFFLTNIGILVCEYDLKNYYKIVNFFYQTTIGRIFFYKNFENILEEFKE